jgi:hypothetical protein
MNPGIANLSLEQAPPISIPFRFFLSAPLFLLAAAVLLVWFGPGVLVSRWSSGTLALTHLFTLGVLASAMFGALFQMLPVLAGSPVLRVTLIAPWVHVLLTAGTAGLVVSFLLGSAVGMAVAGAILGLAIVLFVSALAVALWRVKVQNATTTAMWLAVVSLGITAALGLHLVVGMSGLAPFVRPFFYTDLHLGWGLLGWVALLLMGVAYQVVPMFQVTPEYPVWMRRRMVPALFAGLTVWSLLAGAAAYGRLPPAVAAGWMGLLVAGQLLFAWVTLRLQQQRRRRVSDVTVLFWRTGLIAVGVCGLLWTLGRLCPEWGARSEPDLLLGVGLLLGAAVSLVNGMLYKIVPFLSWFHLQNRQLATGCLSVRVPNMKELLSDRAAKRQFWAHLAALGCSAGAVLAPDWLARPAGLLLGGSALLLGTNLFSVVAVYRRTNRELLAAASAGGAACDP